MKKIIPTFTFFLFALTLLAQPNSEARQQQRNQRYQQIQSAKIAFFTSEIQLTPKEAEEFWPIYNQYWKEREGVMRKAQSTLKSINKALSGEEKVSEQELKRLVESFVNQGSQEGEIHKEYYNKLSKILSVEKMARMYKAEDDFRMKMIHQFRGGMSQPPQPK